MEHEKQRERLVELLSEFENNVRVRCPKYDDPTCDGCEYDLDRECDKTSILADYLLANNVVVLPCKEGSTVYVIKREDTECHLGVIPSEFACQGCEETECDSFSTYRIRELNNINKWTILDYLWQGRFGKDVFVERAEAEKALAEKNNV